MGRLTWTSKTTKTSTWISKTTKRSTWKSTNMEKSTWIPKTMERSAWTLETIGRLTAHRKLWRDRPGHRKSWKDQPKHRKIWGDRSRPRSYTQVRALLLSVRTFFRDLSEVNMAASSGRTIMIILRAQAQSARIPLLAIFCVIQYNSSSDLIIESCEVKCKVRAARLIK